MSRIETALHDHYATTAAAEASAALRASDTSAIFRNEAASSATLETPFAKVNSVVAGSPADTAGMKAGDKIQRFGDANWLNHEKLSKVAQIVSQNEGVSKHSSFVKGSSLINASVPYRCRSGDRITPPHRKQ